VTEYLAECRRNTPPWNQYTRRMLRHKAFMQCVRVAFGLGGIHDEDEARDIMQNESGGTPSVTTARIAALNAAAKVTNRPVSEGQTFEPDPAAMAVVAGEPATDEGEQDISGADTSTPDGVVPDVSSAADFYDFMSEMAQRDKVEVFDTAMERVRLVNATNGEGVKARMARRAVAEAAMNRRLDWESGKVIA
jgi:hypothetical protein